MGDEVIQVYCTFPDLEITSPNKTLIAFNRVEMSGGDSKEIEIRIPLSKLQLWNSENQRYQVYPGKYQIQIGGSSEDVRLGKEILVKNVN